MNLPVDCGCHGLSRRHFLFGAASAAQLLAMTRRAEAQTSANVTPLNSADACIFINMQGGPSHLDTFDPKDGPWNPADADIRQYGGVALSNRYFPNLSRISGDLLILRSVTVNEVGHDRGQFYVQTGRPLNPAFATEIPHAGAICAYEKGNPNALLPPFLSFNDPGVKGATFLGGRFEPFQPGANMNGLSLLAPALFNTQREFDQRYSLLSALDAPLRLNPAGDDMKTYSDFYQAAKNMMFNDPVATVFRFNALDDRRYGATPLGRSLIVARNAIQARNGAAFINVAHAGWDQHFQMFDVPANVNNHYRLANDLDTAVSSLVEDLRNSGDLPRTLIVLMGEFGRTPGPLTPRAGRDHYRDVMSVLMIGGGAAGGRTIGVTSPDGSRITDPGWSGNRPIALEDLMATIYSALGIDWTKSITSNTNRVWQYVTGAADGIFRPIGEVFG